MSNLKYLVIDGNKKCGKCGAVKPINEFYKHKNYYRSYCKSCQNKSTEEYRANPANKDKWKKYSKDRYNKPGVKQKKFKGAQLRILKIKQQAVKYKGGKCNICGYNKCITALEFHHINPSEKNIKFNSRGIDRRVAFEVLKKELDKCILLCANCHRETHANAIKHE